MENIFLRDLAVVLAVAAGTTMLCRLLHQPVVIGYLLAGLIIGPHTPPFTLVHDIRNIQTMAELGLVVLMFVLGLEFSLPKLRKVGARATLATLLEIFGMLGIGFALGRAFGWNTNDSIYLGAILAISSTTIIIKVLTDLKLTKEVFAQAVFAILILEDIAAVVILTVLSGLGARQGDQGLTALRAMGSVSFFVAIFLILGLLTVPRLMRWLSRFRSSEMTGLTAFGLCLASSLMAEHFGFSVALGAFLIGAVIGVSPEVERIEEWIHPVRDLFSALFFVSAGLLIDPKLLWSIKGPVLIVTVVTIFGKMATGAIGSYLAGYPIHTATKVGMTLAQIGEFSFVFAALGLKTKLGSAFLYPLAVAVSALTTLFTPYLIRYSDRIVEAVFRGLPLPSHAGPPEGISKDKSSPGAGTFMARYLSRLGVYLLLLVGAFLLTKGTAEFLPITLQETWGMPTLWFASWMVQLPLSYMAAGYLNHCLLLLFTELAVRSKASGLLQKVPIQETYIALEILLWLFVSYIWANQVEWLARVPVRLVGATLLLVGLAWGIKRLFRTICDHLETWLDEIFGLASNEPLRRAALDLGHPDSLLNDSIQRIRIVPGAAAVRQSLRELRLRERTGASVIGIYRDGTLTANPSPETTLDANDIVVVLGDATEGRLARQALTQKVR